MSVDSGHEPVQYSPQTRMLFRDVQAILSPARTLREAAPSPLRRSPRTPLRSLGGSAPQLAGSGTTGLPSARVCATAADIGLTLLDRAVELERQLAEAERERDELYRALTEAEVANSVLRSQVQRADVKASAERRRAEELEGEVATLGSRLSAAEARAEAAEATARVAQRHADGALRAAASSTTASGGGAATWLHGADLLSGRDGRPAQEWRAELAATEAALANATARLAHAESQSRADRAARTKAEAAAAAAATSLQAAAAQRSREAADAEEAATAAARAVAMVTAAVAAAVVGTATAPSASSGATGVRPPCVKPALHSSSTGRGRDALRDFKGCRRRAMSPAPEVCRAASEARSVPLLAVGRCVAAERDTEAEGVTSDKTAASAAAVTGEPVAEAGAAGAPVPAVPRAGTGGSHSSDSPTAQLARSACSPATDAVSLPRAGSGSCSSTPPHCGTVKPLDPLAVSPERDPPETPRLQAMSGARWGMAPTFAASPSLAQAARPGAQAKSGQVRARHGIRDPSPAKGRCGAPLRPRPRSPGSDEDFCVAEVPPAQALAAAAGWAVASLFGGPAR